MAKRTRRPALVVPLFDSVRPQLIVVGGLEHLFTAAAIAGTLAAQAERPDPDDVCRYAADVGRRAAAEVRKHRRKPS